MYRPPTVRRTAALLAALVAVAGLAAAGCSKSKPRYELPAYPSSTHASGVPDEVTAAGTIVRETRETPDGAKTVAEWCRRELVEKLGWTLKPGTATTFTDGNVEVVWRGASGPGTVTPLDPTRPGAQVLVLESNNSTLIKSWVFLPKE